MGVLGVEPRTSSLSGTRSNQLSYTPSSPLKSCLRRRLRRLTLTRVKASGTFRGPRSPFFRAAYAVLKTASKVGFIKYLKSCLRRRLRRLTLTCVKASGIFQRPRSPFFRAACAVLKTASKVFFYFIRLLPDSKAYLVEPKGLEPSTSCLQSRCSSQLSYGPGSYLRPFGTLTVFITIVYQPFAD